MIGFWIDLPDDDPPESFVKRSEPTSVTTGAEEDEPQKREAKVYGTSTASPPGNTGDHV